MKTELLVSDDVANVPRVLFGVGDSLAAGDPVQADGGQSPSLAAALWVSNKVLPQLSRTNVDHIYAAGEATREHHRAVVATDAAFGADG